MTSTLTVSALDADLRLDLWLAKQFDRYSRNYFQNLISEGLVLINGKAEKKRTKLKSGDELEICFAATPEIALEPQDIPLSILYEDDHLIALDKPSGMVVHPAIGHPDNTLVNALLFHCKHLPLSSDLRPGIVHRLDKETTGVIIAAKTREAHLKLVEMFSERQIKKWYVAICLGNPGDRTVSAPIGRHPIHRQKMSVRPEGGREATTRIEVIGNQRDLSLLKVELITGRTHQIRVHLKHLNTPILGDPVYGSVSANRSYGVDKQLLHAYRMEFAHPITQQPIELKAPVPAEFFNEKFGLSHFRLD
jgi:23S rRNA pseudouridine1911/1915/1917 synthase